jgi:hypothetical protein
MKIHIPRPSFSTNVNNVLPAHRVQYMYVTNIHTGMNNWCICNLVTSIGMSMSTISKLIV